MHPSHPHHRPHHAAPRDGDDGNDGDDDSDGDELDRGALRRQRQHEHARPCNDTDADLSPAHAAQHLPSHHHSHHRHHADLQLRELDTEQQASASDDATEAQQPSNVAAQLPDAAIDDGVAASRTHVSGSDSDSNSGSGSGSGSGTAEDGDETGSSGSFDEQLSSDAFSTDNDDAADDDSDSCFYRHGTDDDDDDEGDYDDYDDDEEYDEEDDEYDGERRLRAGGGGGGYVLHDDESGRLVPLPPPRRAASRSGPGPASRPSFTPGCSRLRSADAPGSPAYPSRSSDDDESDEEFALNEVRRCPRWLLLLLLLTTLPPMLAPAAAHDAAADAGCCCCSRLTSRCSTGSARPVHRRRHGLRYAAPLGGSRSHGPSLLGGRFARWLAPPTLLTMVAAVARHGTPWHARQLVAMMRAIGFGRVDLVRLLLERDPAIARATNNVRSRSPRCACALRRSR